MQIDLKTGIANMMDSFKIAPYQIELLFTNSLCDPGCRNEYKHLLATTRAIFGSILRDPRIRSLLIANSKKIAVMLYRNFSNFIEIILPTKMFFQACVRVQLQFRALRQPQTLGQTGQTRF